MSTSCTGESIPASALSGRLPVASRSCAPETEAGSGLPPFLDQALLCGGLLRCDLPGAPLHRCYLDGPFLDRMLLYG